MQFSISAVLRAEKFPGFFAKLCYSAAKCKTVCLCVQS